MDVTTAANSLWQAMQQDQPVPANLSGNLKMADAYPVQKQILQNHLNAGETLAGWKIALSAAPVREMFKQQEPVRGYLLASREIVSGSKLELSRISQGGTCLIESEFCFEISADLEGPVNDPEEVFHAVKTVAPAFEIAQLRTNLAKDMPLAIADNTVQWGFVRGQAMAIEAANFPWRSMQLEMQKNHQTVQQLDVGNTIDDHFQLIMWLVNNLAQHGQKISAGQVILTGSCSTPSPVSAGEFWQTTISDLGSVALEFT